MLLSDIKTLLISISPTIFLGEIPDTPDNLVCIFFAGGMPPVHSFDGRTYERPSFQVRVRNTSAATAIQWAEQAKDALDGINDLTINSTRYIDVSQAGDIMPLGKDAKGRTELTINFNTKTQR